MKLVGSVWIELFMGCPNISHRELVLACGLRVISLIAREPNLGAFRWLRILRDVKTVPSLLDREAKNGVGFRKLTTHGKPNRGKERSVRTNGQKPRNETSGISIMLDNLLEVLERGMNTLKKRKNTRIVERCRSIVVFSV